MMPDRIADLRRLYDEEQLQDAWHLYLETPCQSAEWHNLGCKVAYSLNLIHAARAAVERALSLNPQGDQKALAHFQAGELNRRLDDLTVAQEHFALCLGALENAPTLGPVLRGPCLFNWALAQYHSGLHEEAFEGNEKALAVFRQENLTEYCRGALLNAAWYASDLGKWDRAESALAEAEPLCQPGDALRQYQLTSAYFLFRHGDHSDAAPIAKDLVGDYQAGEEVPTENAAIAAAILAEIALFEGLIESAYGLVSYAYDLAWRDPKDRRCMSFVAKTLSNVNKAKQKGA